MATGSTNAGGSMGYAYNVQTLDGNATSERVALTWTDPDDADWLGTKIVRKTGSYPRGMADGTVVADNRVRNQYAAGAFIDTGVDTGTGTLYYYQAFPYAVCGPNTSVHNRFRPFRLYSLSYTGEMTTEYVEADGVSYTLVSLLTSGVLTVKGAALTARAWLCGGGAAGSGSRGGGGGFTASADELTIEGANVVTLGEGGVGNGANGGATTGFGLTAAGGQSSTGAGGSGAGGQGALTGGTGAGKSTVPFGLTDRFSPHCPGGGGPGAVSYDSAMLVYTIRRGGVGGSDGATGGTGSVYTGGASSPSASGGEGGAKGGGKGGTASSDNLDSSGSAGTAPGAGGGGYATYQGASGGSKSGTAGSGYKGAAYLLIAE